MKSRFPRPRRSWFALPLSLFLVLNSGCAVFPPAKAVAAGEFDDPYDVAYLEASLALSTGKTSQAIDLLDSFRKDSEAPPEMMVLLTEALMRSNKEDEARTVIDQTIASHPTFIPALRMRATMSRLKSDYASAIQDIETAIQNEPKNPEMLEELGMLRYRTLRNRINEKGGEAALEELLDIYRRLTETRQGSEKIRTLNIMSGIYSEMGRHDKAIEVAKQAVNLRSQNLQAQRTLALAYENAKQPAEALAAYRQALLLSPEDATIRSKVAELVAAEGKAGGLLGFYEELAHSFPKLKEIQNAYAEELVKAREWRKAADQNRKMLEIWPDDQTAKMSLIVSLFMLNEESEALKITDSLVTDKNFSAKAVTELAQMLARAGKIDAATSLYRRISAADPNNDQVLLGLAGAQIDSGKTQEAIETLQKLVDRRPDLFIAGAMLGQLLAEKGKFNEAHTLYDKIEKNLTPENVTDLQVRKADLFRREGKPEEARKVLEQLTAKDGAPEVAVRMLVELYAADGDFAKAHSTVDKFVSKATGQQVGIWQNLKAWLYWKEKRYKDAAAILEGLHAGDPSDFAVIQFLADTYAEMKDFEKAQGLLKASETVLPEDSKDDLLMLRARLYKKEKKAGQAVQVVEEVLKRNRDNEKLLLEAAEYYHEAGRIEDAEKVLRRAIELNPSDSEAYNALGYFFAEANVKLDEALTLVQKALEMNPNAGHILDSLGWVYYRQGKYDKAIETLEAAVKAMNKAPDATILEHLGDAYSKAGRSEKAKESWSQALKLDPESEGLKQKLK